jgi:hypothetical protein
MRTYKTAAVAVVLAAGVLLAAMPQDAHPAPPRVATKYGDRLAGCVGKSFDLVPDASQALQSSDGKFKLVAVGVDYCEFETEGRRVAVPLSILRVSFLK